jgi:hypothetical protein
MIQTRWRLALGRSSLPRYYAIVLTADGHDLNELLVNAGLARIYGTRTPLPDGRDSRTIPRTFAGTGNTSQTRTARRMEQSALDGITGQTLIVTTIQHRSEETELTKLPLTS